MEMADIYVDDKPPPLLDNDVEELEEEVDEDMEKEKLAESAESELSGFIF